LPLQLITEQACSFVKPAAEYFADNYAADFRMHGDDSLCGFTLIKMMKSWHGGRFPHFPEFALCQFALNLHNQAFYAHFRELRMLWREYSAPFGNTLLCFSGHGLGSHNPDSIMRFVQAPLDRSLPPVRWTWEHVSGYAKFFFGDYLEVFADAIPADVFSADLYLRALRLDGDARVSVRIGDGWSCRNISNLPAGGAPPMPAKSEPE